MRLPFLLAVALVLVVARVIAAHSLLLDSSPPVGAVLTAAPARVTLTFNNRIEKPLSRLRLVDDRGEARTLKILVEDGPAERLTAPLPALGPGGYRVEWQVLSTDGHIVNGRFSFRIAR